MKRSAFFCTWMLRALTTVTTAGEMPAKGAVIGILSSPNLFFINDENEKQLIPDMDTLDLLKIRGAPNDVAYLDEETFQSIPEGKALTSLGHLLKFGDSSPLHYHAAWTPLNISNTTGRTNCRGNGHFEGEWIKVVVDNKAFVCCGEAVTDVDIDPRYCASKPLFFQYGVVGPSTPCGDDCCACDRRSGTRYAVSSREQYVWIPKYCDLIPWNGEKFCDLLQGRKVLIVGDSTMQQSFSTLSSMISSDSRATCADQISYGRHTHLLRFAYQDNLLQYITKTNADIIIINAGAHLDEYGDLISVFQSLERDLHDVRYGAAFGNYRMPVFIWKTQSPGNINCQQASGPLPWGHSYDKEDTERWDKYHWSVFRDFDTYALKQVALLVAVFLLLLELLIAEFACSCCFSLSLPCFAPQAPNLGMRVMDMRSLYLRPDAHVLGDKNDCLHFCEPGLSFLLTKFCGVYFLMSSSPNYRAVEPLLSIAASNAPQ